MMDRASMPLQRVEVLSAEPPLPPKNRPEDKKRLYEQGSRAQIAAGFKFCMALVVRDWKGLSLIRLLAVYIGVTTGELAHDWIAATKNQADLGFAFASFVLGGFFLAVVTGLGEKYIDKLLTIVGVRLGVALTNPVSDFITERIPHGARDPEPRP